MLILFQTEALPLNACFSSAQQIEKIRAVNVAQQEIEPCTLRTLNGSEKCL